MSLGSPDQYRGGTYLLTWTTYASWLPGDARGFVSRVPSVDGYVIHNRVGTPQDADMPCVRNAALDRLRGEKIVLSRSHARCCQDAFEEVAAGRAHVIHACAIMATHVHVVVRSETDVGEELLRRFKGVSSRRLSQAFGKPNAPSWWTRHGSRRLLTTPQSREGAVQYTLTQERPLVLFGTLVRERER